MWHSAYMTLSISTLCHYAECGVLIIIMLNVVMLSLIMLNVVAPKNVSETDKRTSLLHRSKNYHCKKLNYTGLFLHLFLAFSKWFVSLETFHNQDVLLRSLLSSCEVTVWLKFTIMNETK
jgi:hypothetical protein